LILNGRDGETHKIGGHRIDKVVLAVRRFCACVLWAVISDHGSHFVTAIFASAHGTVDEEVVAAGLRLVVRLPAKGTVDDRLEPQWSSICNNHLHLQYHYQCPWFRKSLELL